MPIERRLVFFPPKSHWWRTAWSRLGHGPVEWLAGPLDVFHFSDWMYPPQRGGIRATTIHDLFPLRFPDWVHPQTYRMHTRKYAHAAQTCDLIVVNSEFTAGEVVELLGFPRERICVAYPGIDPIFRPDGPERDLGGPYLLTVATLERRKNLETLLEAMPLVRRNHPELRLAVVGAPGWQGPSLDAESVVPLGYVDDEELAALYRGAEVVRLSLAVRGLRDADRRGDGVRHPGRRLGPPVARRGERRGRAAGGSREPGGVRCRPRGGASRRAVAAGRGPPPSGALQPAELR